MPTQEFIAAKIREAAAPTVGTVSDHELQITPIDVSALPYNWELVPPEDRLRNEAEVKRVEAIHAAAESVREEFPRIDW
ncbi:hypothetical protein ABLE91_15100 [Aquabacter sp. CN5-332]|uniref:hypothetical protein n=1 Tax=Aquabacter sp. CN5-332 TaxID=3156608 RepID=UPI0032B43170